MCATIQNNKSLFMVSHVLRIQGALMCAADMFQKLTKLMDSEVQFCAHEYSHDNSASQTYDHMAFMSYIDWLTDIKVLRHFTVTKEWRAYPTNSIKPANPPSYF